MIFIQGFSLQQRLPLATIPSEGRIRSGMSPPIRQLTYPRHPFGEYVAALHSASSSEANNSSEDEFDPELEAMKKEIEALVMSTTTSDSSSAPINTAAVTGFSANYNKYIAAISALLGSAFFIFQHGQPVSSVALLRAMEKDSVDVKVAMCNGKPTLVEFYADWCESCKVMAPTMRSLEAQYRDKINFITIDGSSPRNGKMPRISQSFSDFIPIHLASLVFLASDTSTLQLTW